MSLSARRPELPQSLLSAREVAILAATRGHWGSRRHRNSGDFSDHRHNLAKNPGAARFLGIRTSWDTFLILLLWKLWLEFWFSLWHKSLFYSRSVTFDFSSTTGYAPLPSQYSWRTFSQLIVASPTQAWKKAIRRLEFCFRLGCLCLPSDPLPEVLQPSLPAVSGLFTNLMHLLVPGGANKLEHKDFLLECFIILMLKSEMRTLEDSQPYFFMCRKKICHTIWSSWGMALQDVTAGGCLKKILVSKCVTFCV